MEIKLYGHSEVNKTVVKGIDGNIFTFAMPLTKVCEPLAKLTLDKTEGETRDEKRLLLPDI